MKRYFLISALSCCLYLYSSAQTSTSITPALWQEDVKYFKEQLVKKHANIFHHVSQEEFEVDIDRLYNNISSLKDYQIVVQLMQIAAKVGDAHTRVHIPPTFRRYPVALNWFGDSLYVVNATAENKEVIGALVTKIGDLAVEEVNKRVASVIPIDENKWFEMYLSASFITRPEILFTLGIVPGYDHAQFIFLDSNNKQIALDLKPVPADSNITWTSVNKSQPLYRQKQKDPFWFTYLEDINAVYLSFKEYDNLERNANKLFDFIEEKKATRLIVDLRFNGGGDFKKGRRLLISKIKENLGINQKGNLFVITGRGTFSAAMVNAIDFKKETNAIILGEPPGEKPNSYSENDEMKLPNSGLIVSYSTKYYKFLDEDAPAFKPDVRIDPNWSDYIQGRDAVLEYIISYCKK